MRRLAVWGLSLVAVALLSLGTWRYVEGSRGSDFSVVEAASTADSPTDGVAVPEACAPLIDPVAVELRRNYEVACPLLTDLKGNLPPGVSNVGYTETGVVVEGTLTGKETASGILASTGVEVVLGKTTSGEREVLNADVGETDPGFHCGYADGRQTWVPDGSSCPPD